MIMIAAEPSPIGRPTTRRPTSSHRSSLSPCQPGRSLRLGGPSLSSMPGTESQRPPLRDSQPLCHRLSTPGRVWRQWHGDISKLRGYYIILYFFCSIIRIKTLLKHIMTLLYHLFQLQFLDYYVILFHLPEISYYINYITSIISIIFI
jgi:hypothetical protein